MLWGALFGLVFPVLATLIELWQSDSPASFSFVWDLHTTNPLLPIIDTAPFFLGLFSYLLGRLSERAIQIQRARRSEIEGFLDRMKKRNHELKEVNDALDGLLYTASHDLKTPVVNLKSMVKMLRTLMDRPGSEKMIEEVIERMEDATERFDATLDDLLDISRIDLHFEEGPQVVELANLVESILFEMSDLIERKGAVVTMNFKLAPQVRFPKRSLESVLRHLISNGIKYSSDGQRPEVAVQSRGKDGDIVLEVIDNGVGIDLERHGESIFQMFKRLNKKGGGVGLGLYIVRRIMEKGGGRVDVQSRLGEGACFAISIPQINST